MSPSEARHLGNLLDLYLQGKLAEDEERVLLAKLEQLERDPTQAVGMRIAAITIRAAIHSRLIHA